MLRLILMRHSKAEAEAAGSGDHGRRLSKRGRAEATAAGEALAALARPDHVLLSDSARTVGTFERLAASFGPPASHRTTRRLYGASPDTILGEIGSAPADTRTLLVIGHNPGMGDLARRLAGHDSTGAGGVALAALAAHFPTSCFAILALEAATWARIDRSGRLDHLWAPRGETWAA